MRKLLFAAAAGATVLGGAMIAQTVQAQPYGYYYGPAPAYAPGYRYDEFGRPYFDDGYRGPAAAMPYDRFGPDPNGMIAADGHRIKCKLQDDWDGRYDRHYTHRVCD
jgi:hypothetical protein